MDARRPEWTIRILVMDTGRLGYRSFPGCRKNGHAARASAGRGSCLTSGCALTLVMRTFESFIEGGQVGHEPDVVTPVGLSHEVA